MPHQGVGVPDQQGVREIQQVPACSQGEFFLSYNISIQVGVFLGRGPKMLDCWKFCIFIPLLNQWPFCFGLGLYDPTMSTCAAHYFSVLLNKLKTKTQVGVFFGGLAIAKDEQVLKNNCPHIVVGTPGRYLTCCIVSFFVFASDETARDSSNIA